LSLSKISTPTPVDDSKRCKSYPWKTEDNKKSDDYENGDDYENSDDYENGDDYGYFWVEGNKKKNKK
jgi:hypothetical protein